MFSTLERALYSTGIGPLSLLKLRSLQNESHNVILKFFFFIFYAGQRRKDFTYKSFNDVFCPIYAGNSPVMLQFLRIL